MKATPKQWALGGGMLAVGLLGFFVLSGDFGGSDEPPPDGWSERAAMPKPPDDFSQPKYSNPSPVTADRGPAFQPQPEQVWSNPAASGIVQTPTPTPVPSWNPESSADETASGPSLSQASTETGTKPTAASQGTVTTTAASSDNVAARNNIVEESAASPTSTNAYPATNPYPTTSSYPPTNAYPSTNAHPSTNAYPTTEATGLNPPTPPPSLPTTTNYPTTGYSESPFPVAPSRYGPAAHTGMREHAPSRPGPGAGGYPETSPPAMSPRYERIR